MAFFTKAIVAFLQFRIDVFAGSCVLAGTRLIHVQSGEALELGPALVDFLGDADVATHAEIPTRQVRSITLQILVRLVGGWAR